MSTYRNSLFWILRQSVGCRRRSKFMTKKIFCVAIPIVALLAVSRPGHSAKKPAAAAIPMDATDIAGVVTSSKGPEAGVWVIAETKDLGTGYRKIVVTDDQGRYLVPDLPKANYTVWVRGYGLVDSPKVQVTPGKPLDLKAVIAPSPKEAAQYYPAAYWYSLLHIPPKSDFPGTGPSGNGISDRMREQGEWIEMTKTDGCEGCHQLGDKSTREIPANLGAFDSSVAAWERRIQSGQVGSTMLGRATQMGRKRVLEMYADWTDRIKAGELPPVPPRPQGLERNVVVTEWDWAGPKDYFHDEISVDRRNPNSNPDFCKQGSSHPSAIAFPITQSSRQTNFYDPKTKQWTLIDMCASSQHLMFAEDADNTLWFSNPGGDNVGWFKTKVWDETHDVQKSQGWTPFILDTNGNGKRDVYTEPGQPSDPTKDTRIKVGFYGVSPSPVDGSVWGTVLGFPGAIVRLNPGPTPRKPLWRKSMRYLGIIRKRPCKDSHRGAWTLTATGLSGPSLRAGILPASTGA